jgi:hypothetical protein
MEGTDPKKADVIGIVLWNQQQFLTRQSMADSAKYHHLQSAVDLRVRNCEELLSTVGRHKICRTTKTEALHFFVAKLSASYPTMKLFIFLSADKIYVVRPNFDVSCK